MFKFWILALMAVVVQGQVNGNATTTSTTTTTTVNASQTEIPAWISQVPQCAVDCVVNGYGNFSCPLDESTCMCTNQELLASMSACVQLSCAIVDERATLTIERKICKGIPVPDRSGTLKIIAIVLISITVPLVLLRAMSRWFIAKHIGLDDWTIFLATLLLLISTILNIINTNKGFGRHIWTVNTDQIAPLLQFFWVFEILYVVILSLTKISILLFYHRIFVAKWFLACVKVTICFVVFYAIAFILVFLFQCAPMASIWDRTLSRQCLNRQAIIYSNAAISIFQEFLVLALPIPELLSLQVSLRKKVSVVVMFSVGIFSFITSCVRLNYLVSFDNSLDTSWDDVDTTIWSLIELNVSIICACLPALRALGGYFVPGLFRSSAKGTQYCYSQKCQAISRGTKTPSQLNENFITMPEDLIESNYNDGSLFRNGGTLHATRPLSEPLSDELELVARGGSWKETGVLTWVQAGK